MFFSQYICTVNKTFSRLRAAVGAGSLLILGLAACGGGSGSSSSPIPTAAPTIAPTVAPSAKPTTAPSATPTPTTAPTTAAQSRALVLAVSDATGTRTNSATTRRTASMGIGSSVYALQAYDASRFPNMVSNGAAYAWVSSSGTPVLEPAPTVTASPTSNYLTASYNQTANFPDAAAAQISIPTGISSITFTFQDAVAGTLTGSVPVYTYDGAALSCPVISGETRDALDYESTGDIWAPTSIANADIYLTGAACEYGSAAGYTLNIPHGAVPVSGVGDIHQLTSTSLASGASVTTIDIASNVGQMYVFGTRDGGKAKLLIATTTGVVFVQKADVSGNFAY